MGQLDLYPFPLGRTWANGQFTPASTDGANLEGLEIEVVDKGVSITGRSHRRRKLRIVRNVNPISALGKRLVALKAGAMGTQIDGYCKSTAQGFIYPLDEYLTTYTPGGVPQYDLCYIVVRGPAIVLTDLAGGANNLLPTDTVLVGLTGATSGATTAGRVAPQDLTGATALLGNQIQNAIGRALSGRTTAETNADILVDVIEKW